MPGIDNMQDLRLGYAKGDIMATKKFMSAKKRWDERRISIMSMYASNYTFTEIARRYRVSRQRIQQIVKAAQQ